MMRIYVCLAVAILLLSSCGGGKKKSAANEGEPIIVTVNEKVGIKEVTDFYGGECVFKAGTSKIDGKKFARLEMSKSKALDGAMNITELNLANIALVFYKDLEEERKNFEEVQSYILFGDGKDIEKTYPTSLLNMVVDKMDIVVRVVGMLKEQKYDSLGMLVNDHSGIHEYDKKMLIASIKKADASLGKIKSFAPYGFIIIKSDKGKDILHISGMLIREKQNNEFSVDIDPASANREAIFINYKL